jgi:hypothetical protein|tara:strand:+ start:721 stop:855 length:135 start_codon:yes stop_codon:yes gene_type:complete
MDSNLKVLLYEELMYILQQMEDGSYREAKNQLENLINKLQLDVL